MPDFNFTTKTGAPFKLLTESPLRIITLDASDYPMSVFRGKTFKDDIPELYSDMLISNISINNTLKIQILETSGGPFTHIFGNRTIPISFSGIILNSKENKGEENFKKYYKNYCSMSTCAENNYILYLTFLNFTVQGYMLNYSISYQATNNSILNISFQIIPTLVDVTDIEELL